MSHTLILGGGLDQVPLIREAKAFGLHTIVVDANRACPGYHVCDFFIHESNRDVNAIMNSIGRIGLKDNISSVMVIGTDIPHIAQKVSKRLGINYWASKHAVEIATNKVKMKNFLHDIDISSPPQKIVNSAEEVLTILKNFNFRNVLKPQEAAGSRGVFLIDYKASSDAEVFQIYNKCLQFCDGQSPVLETYIEGKQLSVEALIVKGEPRIYGYALRNYEMNAVFAPQIIENGGIQPYPDAFGKVDEVKSIINKICSQMGIENGIIKLDLVIDEETERVNVIEFALRLSGGNFSSDIIPRSLGVNLLRDYISMRYNVKVAGFNFQNYKKLYANRYLFREGRIGADIVIDHNFVEDAGTIKNKGDYIDKIRTHADRAAWFVVSGDTISEIENKVDTIYKKHKRYQKC